MVSYCLLKLPHIRMIYSSNLPVSKCLPGDASVLLVFVNHPDKKGMIPHP